MTGRGGQRKGQAHPNLWEYYWPSVNLANLSQYIFGLIKLKTTQSRAREEVLY